MRLFKRLLGRKNIYFKITEDVITWPEGWTPEIVTLVGGLSEDEKNTLIKICKLLQRHLEHHFDFWIKTDFIRTMWEEDSSLLFKSYFELLMIDWIIITHEFGKKRVRADVGQTLWWVIHYSLIGYSKVLFSSKTFKTYELAFESRRKLYPNILASYFSEDKAENDIAYQNIYTLVIANPMTNDITNLENETLGHSLIGGKLDFVNWRQNMVRTISFNRNFSKGIGSLHKELNKLI